MNPLEIAKGSYPIEIPVCLRLVLVSLCGHVNRLTHILTEPAAAHGVLVSIAHNVARSFMWDHLPVQWGHINVLSIRHSAIIPLPHSLDRKHRTIVLEESSSPTMNLNGKDTELTDDFVLKKMGMSWPKDMV